MDNSYLFREEIIREILEKFVTQVNDEDFVDKVREHVGLDADYGEMVLLLQPEQLDWLSQTISDSLAQSEAAKEESRSKTFLELKQHDSCKPILQNLVAQRNDLIAAVCKSRNLCFQDSYPSAKENMYVELDALLEELRPRLSTSGQDLRPLPDPNMNDLDYSEMHTLDMDERAETLKSQADNEIMAHDRCAQIAASLYTQTDRLTRCLETVFAEAKLLSEEKDDEIAVWVHYVLPSLKIKPLIGEEGNVQKSAVGTIYPSMDDPDYCMPYGNDGNGYHSDPHRACPRQYSWYQQ